MLQLYSILRSNAIHFLSKNTKYLSVNTLNILYLAAYFDKDNTKLSIILQKNFLRYTSVYNKT